jgi:hypothetical protein
MREDNRTVTTTQSSRDLDAIEKTSPAYKDGVRSLYKFMTYPAIGTNSIDNAERRRRVDALLRDGELYFATARELNDPFEAAPHFRTHGTTSDDILEVLSRYLRSVVAPRDGWNKEQVLAKEKDLLNEIRSGEYQLRMQGLAQSWREKFRTDFPMCCLAATRDSTLMWSYYSGGHSGICIHIDATKAPFTNAERVIYAKQYPELLLPTVELESEALRTLALLTKSDVWVHEREYRLINMPMTFEPDNSMRILDDMFTWKTPQLAVIQPFFIVGATIGASMQDEEIEHILRICHERPIKIPVFQAKCRQDRFDLEFVQIT